MPKYDAKCDKCGIIFEYEAPIRDAGDPPPPCAECGNDKTVKVFRVNGGGFVLKGTGWYKKGGY